MLLIISAKVAHSLWRYFSFSAEYTAVSPSANKPPRADAKTFDKNDVQLISQQNWFGKYQPVATPVKQPEEANRASVNQRYWRALACWRLRVKACALCAAAWLTR